MAEERIKADILHRLFRKRMWQNKHTAFEKLYKHAPSELCSEFHEAAKELIKEGLILMKPTSYGKQVSLNIAKKNEIIAIIKKFFEDAI